MGIEYAVEQLSSAVETLAGSDQPLVERVQRVWDERIQNLWSSLYLTSEFNERFQAMWNRYTASSGDPKSTVLRQMSTMSSLAPRPRSCVAPPLCSRLASGAERSRRQRRVPRTIGS